MTQGYRDGVEALRWLINDLLQEKFQFVYALLGDGQGNVDVPGRENYVYVRYERASDRVSQVFNRTVTGGHNTPIVVGYLPWQPDLQQVLDVNWQTWVKQEGVWTEDFGGNTPHGESHERSDNKVGADTFDIYARQIHPLRLESLSTAVSGTFSVRVQPYGLSMGDQYRYWPGSPNIDLSGLVPATGSQRYALVYWNPLGGEGIYGRLGVVTGSLAPYDGVTFPDRPAEPAGTIPSGYALLYGGQAKLQESNLYDAREFLTPNTSTGSSSVSQIYQPDGSDVVLEALSDANLHAEFKGRLGIMTGSAPGWPLEVSGDIALTGDLIVANYPDTSIDMDATGVEIITDAISMIDASGSKIHINKGGDNIDTQIAGDTDANLLYIDAGNDRVGIGTATPAAKLEVNGAGLFRDTLTIRKDGNSAIVNINTYRDAASMGLGIFRAARGSVSSPTAIQSGDLLGRFSSIGYHSGGAFGGEVAALGFKTEENFTPTAQGTGIDFQTTATGGTSRTSKMRLYANGGLVVGGATGASKGAGSINTAADIYKNNSAYTNPDFSLEHYFTGKIELFKDNPGAAEYGGLLPLVKLRDYLRGNLHLPGRTDKPMGVFERADLAQQWIEELALYITELHQRVERLEAKLGNA